MRFIARWWIAGLPVLILSCDCVAALAAKNLTGLELVWPKDSRFTCRGILSYEEGAYRLTPDQNMAAWCDADIADKDAGRVLAICKPNDPCEVKGVIKGHGTFGWAEITSVQVVGGMSSKLSKQPKRKVVFDRGEGGSRMDALIALDDFGRLTTRIRCKKRMGEFAEVQLGLYCARDTKLLKELEAICSPSDNAADAILSICINGECRPRKWRYLESGFGDAFFADEVIDTSKAKSLRIVIPQESQHYEFRGDFASGLKKICR